MIRPACLRALWILLFSPALLVILPASADDLAPAALVRLVGNGSVLLRSPEGEDLVRIQPERSLIPASLVKIPLAQASMAALGEDYRFETHFYQNSNGDLLIRGLGDPFLVSEEVALIADHLVETGVTEVNRLVMDATAFTQNIVLPGQSVTLQPYGAINSALAVNFNTVNLAWSADGELLSAEPQTPLTPLARELAEGLTPGQAVRINLGTDPVNGLKQVHQVFLSLLAAAGVTVNDTGFHQQSVSDEWTRVYAHRSTKSLRDNLEGLLHYSNNFIANQLFLAMGANAHGYPANADSSREVLVQHLQALYGAGYGERPDRLLMDEGSGLSREQRTTAAGMMHILETFLPHADLLDEVEGVYRKSGTLTGVYNFAGYIPGPGGLYPFVILTNQSANRRAEILRHLQTVVQ